MKDKYQRNNKLVETALAIEEKPARGTRHFGRIARALVRVNLPHSEPDGQIYRRRNGKLTLTIVGHPDAGIPYGTYPRLLLAWITTEAVRTNSPELKLGNSFTKFMEDLGLTPTGGSKGTIPRFRDQMKRLFSSSFALDYSDQEKDTGIGFRITKQYHLWKQPKDPEQAYTPESSITLSQDIFKEFIYRSPPIDLRAYRALKQSSMALDQYAWFTLRMSYLKTPTMITWRDLREQFGANFQRPRDFKPAFLKHLEKVRIVYPELKVSVEKTGLLLLPSKPHIAKKKPFKPYE